MNNKTTMRHAFENAGPLRGYKTGNVGLVKRIIKLLEGGSGIIRSGYKGNRPAAR
jgi:hypothetical protein